MRDQYPPLWAYTVRGDLQIGSIVTIKIRVVIILGENII